MALDPTVLIEGVGGGAAAVGVVRRRRRAPRVRRDPIDVGPIDVGSSLAAGDVLVALEAEVNRVTSSRAAAEIATDTKPEPEPEPDPEPGLPAPAAPVTRVARVTAPSAGIPPDSVRAWMDQVQGDLRKVRARVEYLEAEQSKLEEQQRLLAQLVTTSTPL